MDNSKIVAITGASSGFGYALASLFASDGDKVALLARRIDRLKNLEKEIHSLGGESLAIACDVADKESVKNAFNRIKDEWGPVDLLIVNAGVHSSETAPGIHSDDMEWVFRVNYFGAGFCIEQVLPDMMSRGKGHIVGVSSLAGYRGIPGGKIYGASKAALTNMLEGLRIELKPHNIDVTTICPGYVKTEMTSDSEYSMPFLLDLDVAAKKMYRAIQKKKTHFAFPWQMATIVRFGKLVPNAIYDRLARIVRSKR